MSDWRNYGEELWPKYEFPSAVPDFQNSVGAANAKLVEIGILVLKKQAERAKSATIVFREEKFFPPLSGYLAQP